MSVLVLLPIGTFLVVVPALLTGLVLWLVSRGRTDRGGASARAARRHELLVSTLAAAAALAVVIALFTAPIEGAAADRGIYMAVTPLAVAAVYALVRAAGELTWPGPRGEVRVAPLARRTPWSLGGLRFRVLLATTGALTVGLVSTSMTADATGRMFATATTLADGSTTGTLTGPYPGWAYAAPMLAALAIVVVSTWLALTAITRRRPLAGVAAPHDNAVRRTSTNRVLAGVQFCVGFTFGSTAYVAGRALVRHGRSLAADGAMAMEVRGLMVAGTVVIVLGVAVGLASAAVAGYSVWARRVPRALSAEAGAVA